MNSDSSKSAVAERDRSSAAGAGPYARWQPISTAPKDGTEILAYSEKHGEWSVVWHYAGHWSSIRVNGDPGGVMIFDDLSHWMPLLAPPTVDVLYTSEQDAAVAGAEQGTRNRVELPSQGASEEMVEAARRVIAARFSTFKARNGRDVGIEDDSGEKCWIVPFDAMAELEAALAASQ